MGMILRLSDDERTSIAYYLSTMDLPGLVDLGLFFLMLEGSDELSRLVGAELAKRPEAMVRAGVGGTPPDLADEPTEDERAADRELDEQWGKLDDEPPFPHWKHHGAN